MFFAHNDFITQLATTALWGVCFNFFHIKCLAEAPKPLLVEGNYSHSSDVVVEEIRLNDENIFRNGGEYNSMHQAFDLHKYFVLHRLL